MTGSSFQRERQRWREAVRKDKRLTAGQRLILTALDEFRNHKNGLAWPTNSTLGKACGMCRETANRAVNRGEDLGYLFKASGLPPNAGSEDVVVWGFQVPAPVGGVTGRSRGVCASDHRGCDHTVTGGVIVRSHRTPEGTPEGTPEATTPYRPPEGDSRPRAAAKTRNTYPDAFEQWWRTYPRRKNASKKAAHTQWAKAVKEINHQRLLELTATYARNPGVSDERYIPHPQKWLKDQRWESVEETNTGSVSQPQLSGVNAWLGYDPNAPQSDIVDAEIVDTKELPSWIG